MKKLTLSLIVLAGLGLGFISTEKVDAQTPPTCDFTRDLDVGDTGEDVLCLQKFLNAGGFIITSTGAGSPGNETDLFGTLTKEALAKWQTAQGLSPASGYFGPKSRATYKTPGTPAVNPASPSTATPGMPSIQEVVAKLSEYADLIKKLQDENAELKQNTSQGSGNDTVREMLKDAHNMVEDAEDAIDDAEDDGEDVSEDKDNLSDAEEEISDGLIAFIEEDYVKAESHAEDAIEALEDIISDLGGDEEDAQDALDDAEEAIDDAKDEINEADDDDDDVDEAEDLLDDAEDKFEDAEDAFDDEDFDDAIELAEEAQDLAEQAVDAIGN